MVQRYCCVICGIPIRKTSAEPGTVPSEDLEWYQQLRLVQRIDGEDAASTSGVGFVNSIGRICVPDDYSSHFKDGDVILHSRFAFLDLELPGWCFAFHESCWDILLQRVPEGLFNITKFSTIFFQLLFCTRQGNYQFMCPGHDYGGAARFHKHFAVPIKAIIDQGFSFLLAGPSRYRDVPEILSSFPEHGQAWLQQPTRALARRPPVGGDIFSFLPLEIVYMTISLICSADIRSLRIASGFVASVTDFASLPQSFWRSRFCADFDMGFALPVDDNIHQNWRGAYLSLRHALGDRSTSQSLNNRRRIWELVGLNAPLLAQHMVQGTLHGEHCTETTRLPDDNAPYAACPCAGTMISTESFTNDYNPLHSGSRRLHDRHVVMPLDEFTVSSIRISVASFNSQVYISGLQFQLVNTSSQAFKNVKLGYISLTPSQSIEIVPQSDLSGFELATCASGVIGMRLIIDDGHSEWVGDAGNGESQIAFGRLELNPTRRCRLFASFDAFKIIALGIIETDGPIQNLAHCLVSQPLWTPAYPRETATIRAAQLSTSHNNKFRPILNLDFGGLNGEGLAGLTRIVAHVSENSAPFVGFTFYFVDQSYIHYGLQGSVQVSGLIDGPGGELISSVRIEKSVKSLKVVSVRVYTNQGNQLVFDRDELQYYSGMENRPDLSLGMTEPNPFIQPEERTGARLEPLSGQQINGFTATLDDRGSFMDFGLQCEKLERVPVVAGDSRKWQGPPSASKPARLASSIGSYLIKLASNNCRAYTSAPLHSIKRIRISHGSIGRPRDPNQVAGLWIDYYHNSRSEIVGQWISEGPAVELKDGEIMTGVTIWLSKGKHVFTEKYFNGRVVRIMISTLSQTVAYPEDIEMAEDQYIVLRFQNSYMEELSTLVWVFNETSGISPACFQRPDPPAKRSHIGTRQTF
ncbi:hypothetical protein BDV18DRAFT_5054 [Aspergillus unguis]